MSFVALIVIVVGLWIWVQRSTDPEVVKYWEGIIEEGQQFVLDLKEENLTFEAFSKMPDKKQDKLTKRMGYLPDTIDLFVGLSEEFPNQSLLRPKYSKVYREYRVTRQAMRRFPGSGSFKMGPL